MKATREIQATNKGKIIRIAADFSMDILKERKAYTKTLHVLKDYDTIPTKNICHY